MFLRQAFTSLLHLFVVFAFFMAGLFFVAIPYLPEMKAQLFEECTLIGAGLLMLSLLLLLGFYALDRGRYLVIKMGIKADLNVIRQSVEDCFSRQFPKKISLSDIEFGRGSQMQLRVSFKSSDEGEREELYVQVEKHLTTLFRERFGYTKPFYLIIKL